jgi:adenylosuccinate synthase
VEYRNNKPVYKEFDGWMTDISLIKTYKDLPEKTKIYIESIQKYLSVPIDIISNGPGRDQNIFRNQII